MWLTAFDDMLKRLCECHSGSPVPKSVMDTSWRTLTAKSLMIQCDCASGHLCMALATHSWHYRMPDTCSLAVSWKVNPDGFIWTLLVPTHGHISGSSALRVPDAWLLVQALPSHLCLCESPQHYPCGFLRFSPFLSSERILLCPVLTFSFTESRGCSA